MSEQADRRLHPFTIVFAIGNGLREAVFPLVASVLFRRSDRPDLVKSAIILAALVVPVGFMVARYRAFRYRFGERELVIRSGVLFRKERHIPYDRIQNIDAVRNVVHRFFDVATVQIQTGSGGEPEASLSVLAMPAVEEMRRQVAERRLAVGGGPLAVESVQGEPVPPTANRQPPTTLLHLSPGEIALAGFIENRGLAMILAVFAFLMQASPSEEVLIDRVDAMIPEFRWSDLLTRTSADPAGTLLVLALGLCIALAFVRVLSTVWGLVRLWDYRLVRDGDMLRFEYGLLTRVVGAVPLARVQTVAVHRRLLHRLLHRVEVRVTTAGGGVGAKGVGRRQPIAPILPLAALPALLEELHPGTPAAVPSWERAHPRAWRRVAIRPALFALAGGGAAFYLFGGWGTPIALGLVARAVVTTRLYVAQLGWAGLADGVMFRLGSLHVVTTLVRHARVQAAGVRASPFDRRAGMARVVVDTAGGTVTVPYLADAGARVLHDDLAARAEATGFNW